MNELFLLRHADALNGDDDHGRTLSPRGVAEAAVVGARLRKLRPVSMRVLCSSAIRAQETLEGLKDAEVFAPNDAAPPEVETGLYLASASEMTARLRRLPAAAERVLLIAHNPGIYELAMLLAGEGDREAYERLREGLPPAALCQLEIDTDWPNLGPGVGRLISCQRPV
ncbi:MAG: histidine phosphatase family protein [Myxococcota bacterium]|nr:histidine phosphatase family protein [Myxococcota bacterium]